MQFFSHLTYIYFSLSQVSPGASLVVSHALRFVSNTVSGSSDSVSDYEDSGTFMNDVCVGPRTYAEG